MKPPQQLQLPLVGPSLGGGGGGGFLGFIARLEEKGWLLSL